MVSPVTLILGARLLRKHLDDHGLSYRTFSSKSGVGASEICRYLIGDDSVRARLPSLKAAFLIEDATGGEVPAWSWLTTGKHRVPFAVAA